MKNFVKKIIKFLFIPCFVLLILMNFSIKRLDSLSPQCKDKNKSHKPLRYRLIA